MPHLSDVSLQRFFVIGSFVQAHCWTVSKLPGCDESQQATEYIHEHAGKGLAVALGAHRLGAQVDLLMAVGSDAAGHAVLHQLTQEGLATAHIHRLGTYSGQGCGLISKENQTSVSVFPGANALLATEQLQQAIPLLKKAAVIYAQLEVPQDLVSQAFSCARRWGVTTILNPSPWPTTICDGLLACTQILIVNQCEARALLLTLGLLTQKPLDTLPAPLLQQLWRNWPGQWLVITLGQHGVVAYSRDNAVLRLHGHTVQAIQPIGAGDAFSAGLCACLAQNLSMAQALAIANACGALAASRKGILTSLPHKTEVNTFLSQAHPQK
ncbi:hypothetical protein E9531_15950 [Lampropedia puyangensis]|uniref:Carbohydrate kinase PfkB domain-containing protein n=1 Tax=Lampropedia puyangensis TaxID=1330072 RepID=A0A4S8ERH1_9BURK|nr:PfkB family carbohydrate kinase [Lampropedia puyangensis]THT97469.1 hypothetical protein E9531_15950 [Lampropedia puyangensis]